MWWTAPISLMVREQARSISLWCLECRSGLGACSCQKSQTKQPRLTSLLDRFLKCESGSRAPRSSRFLLQIKEQRIGAPTHVDLSLTPGASCASCASGPGACVGAHCRRGARLLPLCLRGSRRGGSASVATCHESRWWL